MPTGHMKTSDECACACHTTHPGIAHIQPCCVTRVELWGLDSDELFAIVPVERFDNRLRASRFSC